jgi:hypothetical protein
MAHEEIDGVPIWYEGEDPAVQGDERGLARVAMLLAGASLKGALSRRRQ